MTTLSSLIGVPLLAATSQSNTADGLASTRSVVSQDAVIGSPSAIVTIPSASAEMIMMYTHQGMLEGAQPTVSWAQNNTDDVSSVMAANYMASSVSGQFSGLGSALLDRFKTTGSDFAQSVTVGSAAAVPTLGQSTQGTSNDIELTVQTASGIKVDIELDSANGTLGVSMKSSGQLTDVERNALAKLSDRFQQAIDGLGASPPKLDLSGLTQYDTSVLSSVNMQFNVAGVSGDFSADNSARSLSLTDSSGTMNLKVDTSQSTRVGSGPAAQRDQAIASYMNEFDKANAKGHGDAAMMAMFKDAFTQLNSDGGTSSQAQSEQAILTGLGDFTASITDTTSPAVGSQPGTFSYQVSQSTSTTGDQKNGTISQTQDSHLKASYQQMRLSSASNDYDDVQIDDDASSTVKLATERGMLTQASLSQTSSESTRNSEHVEGKLVSDVTTPTTKSVSKDLLALFKPLAADGETAQDSSAWPPTLPAIHGMVLLNASAN